MDTIFFIINIVIGIILIYIGNKILKTNKGLGILTIIIGFATLIFRLFAYFQN